MQRRFPARPHALAVLVRHLETVGDALDPYLVEPAVWQLEFSRAIADQTMGLAAQIPNLAHPERRHWSLREVGAMLTLSADAERVAQLKAVGERLQENARARLGDDTSSAAMQHLAAVRTWAASLDRNAYEVKPHDDGFMAQQVTDPEVEQVLGATNAVLRRTSGALGLTARYARVRDQGGRPPVLSAEALVADLVLARALWDDPPEPRDMFIDGPVAAAATAVELHLTAAAPVSEEDLLWSVQVLLQVAADAADRQKGDFDDMVFPREPTGRRGGPCPCCCCPQRPRCARRSTCSTPTT